MVKITFPAVSVQKPGKENDVEKDGAEIRHFREDILTPSNSCKSPVNRLCCITFGLLIFISGLVLVAICVYRNYMFQTLSQVPEDTLFNCQMLYEDMYAPLRGRLELEENVGIHFQDNYEEIRVPVPEFGSSDAADIIHDFHRGLTAYYDFSLDKCYITELNTTTVMPPRSLWELLVNVKRGTYLPQTYIVKEEMMVTGRLRNLRPLGPYIRALCSGKETYRLRHRSTRKRIDRRETKSCHSIRHFANTFAVETIICERA